MAESIPLNYYLILSAVLFCIGATGSSNQAQSHHHLHVCRADAQRCESDTDCVFSVPSARPWRRSRHVGSDDGAYSVMAVAAGRKLPSALGFSFLSSAKIALVLTSTRLLLMQG